MQTNEQGLAEQDIGPVETLPRDTGTPLPLPVLMRVPWFPSEEPPRPAETARRESLQDLSGHRFPMVLRERPAHDSRNRALRFRRRFFVTATLGMLVGMGIAFGWRFCFAWSDGPALPPDAFPVALKQPGLEKAAIPAGGSKFRAAILSPAIVPLDSGGSP